jgi:DNA-binding SARP family transcriptional activator
LRVTLLGPVGYASRDGAAANLGHPRQRRVFAALALRAGEVVLTSDLIDLAWDDDPPGSARAMIHSHVSRLRAALRGAASPAGLAHQHGGYVLEVPPAAVDLHRYRGLVTAARRAGGGATAVARYRAALATWSGEPLGGLPGQWPARVRAQLDLERLSALLECHEGELRLGNHARLVDELRAVAAAYPDNEVAVRNLMIGLYRSGWQADALTQFGLLRTRLAERFGLRPARQTRDLHDRMRRGDPALDPGPPPAGATIAAAAGRAAPDDPLIAPRPRQLPRDVRFAGREEELTALGQLAPSARHVLIEGGPGTGKTALAVHWARQVAARFPDGQVFVPLHGHDGHGAPRPAADVLGYVLRSIGCPDVPAGVDDGRDLFQARAAGKRLLIVADDAASADQVAPLLPGPSSVLLVVTARTASGWPGQAPGRPDLAWSGRVRLGPLTMHQAARLFGHLAGEARAAAEAAAVDEIVALCGLLPAAVSRAAVRAASRPLLPLADLARSMRPQSPAGQA